MKKYIILISTLFLFSCTKEFPEPQKIANTVETVYIDDLIGTWELQSEVTKENMIIAEQAITFETGTIIIGPLEYTLSNDTLFIYQSSILTKDIVELNRDTLKYNNFLYLRI